MATELSHSPTLSREAMALSPSLKVFKTVMVLCLNPKATQPSSKVMVDIKSHSKLMEQSPPLTVPSLLMDKDKLMEVTRDHSKLQLMAHTRNQQLMDLIRDPSNHMAKSQLTVHTRDLSRPMVLTRSQHKATALTVKSHPLRTSPLATTLTKDHNLATVRTKSHHLTDPLRDHLVTTLTVLLRDPLLTAATKDLPPAIELPRDPPAMAPLRSHRQDMVTVKHQHPLTVAMALQLSLQATVHPRDHLPTVATELLRDLRVTPPLLAMVFRSLPDP